MSDVPTGWKRWFWFLRSRKAQVAVVTLVLSVAADWGWNLDAERTLGIVGLGVALILGIAHEDAAAKR